MKKQISILVAGLIISGIVLSLIGTALAFQAEPRLPKVRKIIVFQEQTFTDKSAINGLLKRFGGEALKELPLVNGVAVLLPPKTEAALAKQAGVLRIDNDDVVFALGKPVCGNGIIEGGEKCDEPGLPDCPEGQICQNCKCITPEESTPQPAEEIAWGVDRIDADNVWGASAGSGIKVAIIDSGIDLDHPDLNVAGGYNAINPRKSYDDDFRHGTHVAGIVAAVDNEIGVIGTAPEVKLYAVKVLNRRGIGFASDVIDGLQWCIDNGMQVANMSIGSSGSSQAYHDAVIAAYQVGITIAAAAGNNGEVDGSIVWPARWKETIAVSATCSNEKSPDTCNSAEAIIMDENNEDGLALFSSYASSIDGQNDDSSVVSINLVAGPGQDIKSTWNDGYYDEGSGTSMATPHVAGTIALILKARGCSSENRLASGCNASDIMNFIKNNGIEDLGPTGTDIYFGYGLIDAESAVTLATP